LPAAVKLDIERVVKAAVVVAPEITTLVAVNEVAPVPPLATGKVPDVNLSVLKLGIRAASNVPDVILPALNAGISSTVKLFFLPIEPPPRLAHACVAVEAPVPPLAIGKTPLILVAFRP
jgi:hypothetical protein